MKRNLKLISLLLVLIMALGLLAGCGAKDTDPTNAAFVTLTNAAELATAKDGSYVAALAVEVPAEGTTVGDVLTALHKNYYKDGEAGYATAKTEWGDSITKLWGVENGGSYGYYVNGAMSAGLTDPVKPGDRVEVFIYKDTAGFSDAYTYMTAEVNGKDVKVTVISVGFDANWNPVNKPLEGAKIFRVDGKKLVDTGAVTGADGTATVTLKAGTFRLVSINSDVLSTVSAVKVTVK